jgi:DNA modification methylase
MSVTILVGDVLDKLATLEDESVHCVVTSPPYWGLRDYGVDGQLGLEPTVEEYVEKMVGVFAEVKRVLRPDGTLWLNMGDCYFGGGCGARDSERWPKQSRNDHRVQHSHRARALAPCLRPPGGRVVAAV